MKYPLDQLSETWLNKALCSLAEKRLTSNSGRSVKKGKNEWHYLCAPPNCTKRASVGSLMGAVFRGWSWKRCIIEGPRLHPKRGLTSCKYINSKGCVNKFGNKNITLFYCFSSQRLAYLFACLFLCMFFKPSYSSCFLILLCRVELFHHFLFRY